MTKKNAKKTNVIFIIPDIACGGAQKVLADIVRKLSLNKFQTYIICHRKKTPMLSAFESGSFIHASIEYLLPEEQNNTEHNLVKLLFIKIIEWIMLIYKLIRRISQIDPNADVVCFVESTAINFMFAKMFGLKNRMIISLHAIESIYYSKIYKRKYWRLKRVSMIITAFILKRACFIADEIIVPSNAVKKDLADNFQVKPNKIWVIPNPIDIHNIINLSQENKSYSFDIPCDKTVFCHIARLENEKNHDLLIDACSILLKKGEQFVVFCAGTGSKELYIKERIIQEGLQDNIKLVGYLANPYMLLRCSRALLLTSYHESFSLVLLEAMALSVIAVAMDGSFGPSEILDNGKYGILCTQNDPTALADVMYNIMTNEEYMTGLKTKGVRRAQEYSVENIIIHWENLFNKAYE